MQSSSWCIFSIACAVIGFVAGVAIGGRLSDKEYARELTRQKEIVQQLEEDHKIDIQKREKEADRSYQELSYAFRDKDFENHFSERVSPSDDDPETSEQPYEISESEFERDFQICDSTSINYYVEDEVFTDEKENRISDPEEILGQKAVRMFNEMTIDDFRQVVYIRSPVSDMVYEIIVENEISYYRDVLGIEEDDYD